MNVFTIILKIGKGMYIHKCCPILGGGGGSKMTPKNRIIEGKIGLRGEGGVKNYSKISDIIHELSLTVIITEVTLICLCMA